MKKRSVFIFILVVLLLFTSVIRIYQVSVSDLALEAAYQQSGVRLDIATARGTIYDCNLEPITNNKMEYIAAIEPNEQSFDAIREYLPEEDADAVIKQLSQGKPVAVKVPSDFEAEGATVFKVYQRYSRNQMAQHIIGYLDGDGNGVTAVEEAYNEFLKRDTPLSITYTTDASGIPLAGVDPVVEDSGYDITGGVALTLDADIQKVVEQAVDRGIESGAVVVSEVDTGKIKAIASAPGFSWEDIEASIDDSRSPMINRALSAYNVGSVFKLCVASAALESGISEDVVFNCPGYTVVGEQTFGCLGNHGDIDMQEALAVSCNVYFIHLAQLIGPEPIYEMAARLGFGRSRKLLDGVATEAGNLPALWRLQEQPAALANFSFGQGDLMVSPVAIGGLISAIANDGWAPAPSIVEGTVDEEGEITREDVAPPTRIMSESTAEKMRRMMIGVVESPSGDHARPIWSGAGGKTSTAETGWVSDGRSVKQTWYAGFYPAENPKYSIVVLIEDGESGSGTAAPVFKEIADGIAIKRKIDK